MSPAPDVTNETIILSQASTSAVFSGIPSSDELDSTMFDPQDMDLGSLTINIIESVNSSDDDEPPMLTEDPLCRITTCSAPSTPTGERDPPVIYRIHSTMATTTTSNPAQVEVRYQGARTNDIIPNNDRRGLLGTFLGCFKPILSAMNRFGETIRYTKDTTISAIAKPVDDWEISIDKIINNLELIGMGNEGSVFRGKLNGQDVACKRVKSKQETNIKHLRKLNDLNVIKFRGISVAPPLYYIVMDYCAYGSLYDILKRRREIDSCTKPTQVLDWSRQISNGVDYLHANKMVHRDLKSPNILFFDQRTLKISDFGTSKELVNRRSQIMSFSGTSAWMAPEVIRQEPCSEKIDVWSFGIVVWEILTCAVPYSNIDPTAVMWGVGKGSLTLPIPSSVPEGFKSLMKMCWNQRPSDRPSFRQIIQHLDTSKPEIILFEQEQEYAELTRIWSIEINEHLSKFPPIDISATLQMTNDELMKKRQEELQHIVDIRKHYQKRVQEVDSLYIELKSAMMQLEQREREIKKKERILNINGKKRTTDPISEARKTSLKLIKRATSNLNDPMHLLSHKKGHGNKSNNTSPSTPTVTSPYNVSNPSKNNIELLIPTTIKNNQDSTNTKNIQRRKKGSGHHRNNSKGSATSWTPPSLSAIENQEKRRSSMTVTTNLSNDPLTTDTICHSSSEKIPIPTPLPTVSATIDLKTSTHNRELNPKNLKLDLLSLPPRKSSSSGPEDFDENRYRTSPRPRRRRNTVVNTNKIISSPSAKSTDQPTSHMNEVDYSSQSCDLLKHSKNVTFRSSPSIIHDRSPQQRKTSSHLTYTSSEEGEVEEIHSDNFILDDGKHRAKHDHSYGNVSSESEVYGEKHHQSSPKTDGMFSDEGGHVSDERHESLVNSELEEQ